MSAATFQGVTQTITVDDGSGRPGNCWQAAVATFLGRSLDDVPHFIEHAPYDWELFHGYMLDRGYLTLLVPAKMMPAERCFVFGRSPRDVDHIVLYENGDLLWDPHPSRAGLSAVHGCYAAVRLDEVRAILRRHDYMRPLSEGEPRG